ncbi:MAG: OmpA family protein [Actinomycetota bacterium]
MNRLPAITLGVVGLGLLLALAWVWTIPDIEAELTARAEEELAAASIDGVDVDFDGRNGTLRGDAAGAAQDALTDLRGARWVRAERVVVATTTTTAPPAPEQAAVQLTRDGTVVRLEGTVETDAERRALADQVTAAGLDVENELVVDPAVDGSSIGLFLPLVGPVLDGSDDGELALDDGAAVLTGAAYDPVETEEIDDAVDVANAVGLEVDNQMTTVVLSEAQQIVALQAEIDQIFELARAIEGQNPSFATSEGQLSAPAMATLDRVIVAMRRYPLPGADIIGHTDSRDTEEFNQILSEDRAASVRDYLVDNGVEPVRLTASGRGETEPIADNGTEAGRAENRRVDFIVRRRDG